MANRRMFSNRVANSARFLQMPESSQLLYFHMVIRADDDGVVEAYPLMKLLGSTPDTFKVLIAKRFVMQLNEDQVILINDWLEHNKIRADRKVDSVYKHLIPKDVELLEPKPRSDVKDNSKRIAGQSTDGISKVKLSKDKLSKVRLGKPAQQVVLSELEQIILKYLPIKDIKNKTNQRYLKTLNNTYDKDLSKIERLCKGIEYFKKSDYPYVIYSVKSLYDKHEKIEARMETELLKAKNKKPKCVSL